MKLKDLTKQYNTIKLDSVSEERIRERVFDYFRQSISEESNVNYHYWVLRVLKPAMATLLVFLFVFGAGLGAVAMAGNSLPGDFLYPVKRIAEKSQILLAFNVSHKAVLRAEILNNRLSEARVLTEKVKAGDKESASELNILADNFNKELKTLKKEVGGQVDSELAEPFPTEDLLNTETINQGSLPIQDHRQIFAVIPTEDIEKLLVETQELLADKNMVLALARIEQVEKLVKGEEKIESQESASQEIETQEIQENEEQILEPIKESIEENPQSPSSQLPDVQSSIRQPADPLPNLGSIGNLSKEKKKEGDFKVIIEKESSSQTGMIREK